MGGDPVTSGTEPTAISTSRRVLAEYDALVASDGWPELSELQRSVWAGQLATALRLTLIALGQQP